MKQMIILRKDLNMRKGKMVAQGAHASLMAIISHNEVINHPFIKSWLSNGRFTKVCVSVDSEEELTFLYERAKLEHLPCYLVVDAGLTEFNGVPTKTALAIGPAPDELLKPITGNLKLL